MGGNVQDLQTVSGPEVELILASVTQPSILGPLRGGEAGQGAETCVSNSWSWPASHCVHLDYLKGKMTLFGA